MSTVASHSLFSDNPTDLTLIWIRSWNAWNSPLRRTGFMSSKNAGKRQLVRIGRSDLIFGKPVLMSTDRNRKPAIGKPRKNARIPRNVSGTYSAARYCILDWSSVFRSATQLWCFPHAEQLLENIESCAKKHNMRSILSPFYNNTR